MMKAEPTTRTIQDNTKDSTHVRHIRATSRYVRLAVTETRVHVRRDTFIRSEAMFRGKVFTHDD